VWVTPTDLGKNKKMCINDSARKISEEGRDSCNLALIPRGSVTVSSRAPIGHIAITECDLFTNQGCKSFICGKDIDPEFLFFMLKYRMPDIQSLGSGATFVEVSKSILHSFKITVPPLVNQRRIAARLKAQLAEVEKARRAAEEQLGDVQKLISSVYHETFHGIVPVAVSPIPKTAPVDWQWLRLNEAARLESGHTPSRMRPDWWGGDVSWVLLTEIRSLDGKWVEETKIKTNEEGIANSAARILPKGTVCFSRTASVGFVTIMAAPMATSQDFANWVCGVSLDPEYLMYSLICSRLELRELATGATHKTIYMPTLESFYICAPEISEQKKIVRILKEKLSQIDRIFTSIRKQHDEMKILPQKILARAFETLA
jgi:type I restriction enzyme, S subunit